jgi:hypothetical protein
MPDIAIKCSECDREYRVSEYATVDGMNCLTCGAGLQMPDSADSSDLRLQQGRRSASPLPHSSVSPPKEDEGVVPVIASIHAMKQAGLKDEGKGREFPKWVPYAIALLVMGAFIGFQWKADEFGQYQTIYEWSRNIVALGSWLLVVLVAFQDGLGPGALCLFIPPYSLFYTMACVESALLRGVFYGILVSMVVETYLLQDHSIVLAMGTGMNAFIDHVDALMVKASDSPI